jgi:hypothetical protein
MMMLDFLGFCSAIIWFMGTSLNLLIDLTRHAAGALLWPGYKEE